MIHGQSSVVVCKEYRWVGLSNLGSTFFSKEDLDQYKAEMLSDSKVDSEYKEILKNSSVIVL